MTVLRINLQCLPIIAAKLFWQANGLVPPELSHVLIQNRAGKDGFSAYQEARLNLADMVQRRVRTSATFSDVKSPVPRIISTVGMNQSKWFSTPRLVRIMAFQSFTGQFSLGMQYRLACNVAASSNHSLFVSTRSSGSTSGACHTL